MEWWAIWLIVGGALLIAEMLTLTFYLLWLGIGAVIAAAVALIFPEWFMVHALTGGVVALALTIFTKPLTRRFRESKGYRDAINELVGKTGIVMEEISPGNPGIVKVGNESWSAISIDTLSKDDPIRVISRGTTVLEVQKWGGSSE
ncbi:NfeD family protein [Cohnella luojiensis]|uniref:NfeD family protein n=1 Tax=Cohnella luojiensis TaxID=652876 RepID=A0A4Y8M077_9BACL|nr:NfeD family protein [Cohnella luojiensis]TFE28210.1 NfeD family protein [Cohnella luojiensis]